MDLMVSFSLKHTPEHGILLHNFMVILLLEGCSIHIWEFFMHVGTTNLLWLQIASYIMLQLYYQEMMHDDMLCIQFGGEGLLCTL